MALTIPTDWQVRGGNIISPCTGSSIIVPISYCKDNKGCGVKEFRVTQRSGNLVNVALDANGCLRVIPKVSISLKIQTFNAPGADKVAAADVTAALNLIFNGTGLVIPGGTANVGFTAALADAAALDCAPVV